MENCGTFFNDVKNTHQGSHGLRKHGRKGSPYDAKRNDIGQQKDEQDVHDRGEEKEQKRFAAIAEGAQHLTQEIVKNGCGDSYQNDAQIQRSIL